MVVNEVEDNLHTERVRLFDEVLEVFVVAEARVDFEVVLHSIRIAGIVQPRSLLAFAPKARIHIVVGFDNRAEINYVNAERLYVRQKFRRLFDCAVLRKVLRQNLVYDRFFEEVSRRTRGFVRRSRGCAERACAECDGSGECAQ